MNTNESKRQVLTSTNISALVTIGYMALIWVCLREKCYLGTESCETSFYVGDAGSDRYPTVRVIIRSPVALRICIVFRLIVDTSGDSQRLLSTILELKTIQKELSYEY